VDRWPQPSVASGPLSRPSPGSHRVRDSVVSDNSNKCESGTRRRARPAPPRSSVRRLFARENFPTPRTKIRIPGDMGWTRRVSRPRSAAGCRNRTGSVISRTAPWSVRSAVSGRFGWVSLTYRSCGSLPHTGALADVSVSVGAVIHLLRTRRTCTRSLQTAHK